MSELPEGNAIVYCEKAYATTNGKTAHGLVRRTARYRVLSVVDSTVAGRDAGEALDGRPRGIPIVASIEEAVERSRAAGCPATHLVVGLAPDGGRLPDAARKDVERAVRAGLSVDSGLHDYLSDDPELMRIAAEKGVRIRDVRKPLPVKELHFFSGKIGEVAALKVAVLGTDSAVGKRTTAWMLVEALRAAGTSAELVGTGQTAWMQGVRYGIILDSLVSDFMSGEIEHAVWSAWVGERPRVIVIEGQGSLLNPAYPGGYEILAAARPDVVVLQHAPARRHYDGFPDFPLHPLSVQVQALQLVSGKPVVAVTLSREGLGEAAAREAREVIGRESGLPVIDVLAEGAGPLVELLRSRVGS